MFCKLSRFVVRHPWPVVLVWVAVVGAAVVAGPSFGAASDRQQHASLPADAESQRAEQLAAQQFGGQTDRETGTIVIEDKQGTGSRDEQLAQDLSSWLQDPATGPGHITSVEAPMDSQRAAALGSPDGQATLLAVTFDTSDANELSPTMSRIEEHLKALNLPPGERAGFSSEAAIDHDLTASASGGTSEQGPSGRILGFLVVIVVLALVYRSPLAVIVPLASIGVVLIAAPRLVAFAADNFGLPVSSFSLPFVTVVTLGAGTNYGLFLISRYREELRRGGPDRKEALEAALARVGEAIASSAAAVVLATGLMGLARLELFRTLGPPVAVSVALMLLAGLTLMPALISICDRAFFWPTIPRPVSSERRSERRRLARPDLWARVGGLVVRRPAVLSTLCLVLLFPLALCSSGAGPSFDLLKALPQDTPTVEGIDMLRAHFPDQLGRTTIYLNAPGHDLKSATDSGAVAKVGQALREVPGVGPVGGPDQPARGQTPDSYFGKNGDTVRFEVAIRADSSSAEAAGTVDALEASAHDALRGTDLAGAGVLASGQPAAARDQISQLGDDFLLVGALVSVAILVVLVLLLQSLTAPLYLLLTVALSTGSAIGLTALVYHHALDEPIFYITPLFGFVFLVALGQDFNIFTMSRLREETRKAGLKDGIARAIGATGGVLSSCGLVVAATFSLLLRDPVVFVQQLGVVVVIGVLLDTFLVRPVLVPAIARLLGRYNWVWFPRRRTG